MFFENKGTAENGYVHYEIWGIGTSPHLYWRLKKVSYRTYLLFHYSFGDKKIAFKSPFNLYSNPFIIEFFSSKLKKRYRLRLLLMCLEALGEGFALFSWEILQRGLQETVVSSKAVPKVWNMTYISEFKHGFTNRGCLHCAILKALHSFIIKRAHKLRDIQFFFQNVQNEIFKTLKIHQSNQLN